MKSFSMKLAAWAVAAAVGGYASVAGADHLIGKVTMMDGVVTTSIALDALGVLPDEMRFRSTAAFQDWGARDAGSPLADVPRSFDRVPDELDDWRAFGQSDAEASPTALR